MQQVTYNGEFSDSESIKTNMTNSKSSTVNKSKENKSIATKSLELSASVPEVIAQRMKQLMFSGYQPTPEQYEEFNLMWSEKSDAFMESWQAMVNQASKVNQDIYSSMMKTMFTPWWKIETEDIYTPKKLQKATLSIMNKGLDPIYQKTLSNAERLKSK